MAGRALQIIPPGARQVAPGVYQMTRRRSSGVGRHHHKKHHATRHVGILSAPQIKYAAVMQFADALQAKQNIQVPNFLSFRGLVLYFWGVQKRNKGAISTAKAMLYDRAMSTMGVGTMMGMAMGQFLGGNLFGAAPGIGGMGGAPFGGRIQTQGFGEGAGGGAGGGAAAQTAATAQEINSAANLVSALNLT